VKPFGSWVDQGDKDGVTGYDGDSRGLILGADAMTAAGMRWGAALAYSTSEVDANPGGARHDADIDTWQLAGYGSRSLGPRMEVRFQADLAWSEVDGERTIAFMPGAPVARSDYDNWSVHLGGALGRTYQHGERTTLEPSLRADYTRIESDDYTETGAGALNLDVDSETVEELIVALEGRLSQDLRRDTRLEARAGIGYDVIDDDASLAASFVGGGASFVTPGIDRDPWVGRLGVGLEHTTDQGMQISARYDLEAREDFDNQTASVKVRWRF
jgi:outer membrane autotransporter protein